MLVERGGEVIRDFTPELPFAAGDIVYICGSPESTRKFEHEFPG